MLALWTGQRQGDLLRLPWSAYERTHIKLKQRKTGARVVVKVGLHSRPHLMPHRSAAPSFSRTAKASRGHLTAFAHRGETCKAAGVVGVTFNDLRGTAVTRLALVGATEER